MHTTVSVAGEIDTVNAAEFAATVRDAAENCSGLVLDLAEVDFMAIDGMSALHAINAQLLRDGVQWCVVPSPAVARVLGLCDPEGLIPLARHSALRGAESA